MLEKLVRLMKKHWDVLAYLIFGGLTTLVNYAVYLPLYNLANCSAAFSNCAAWVVAVIFAFLTNKPFVFKSNDWSWKVTFPELVKFVSCRIGSGLGETAIIFLTVDCLHCNGNVIKLVTSVLVVIVNYAASKLLVFKK